MASFLDQKFGLRGKVALVTGSSQGLGQGMARALAQAGADVIVNGRVASKLAPVVKEIETFGGKATAIAADLGDRASVEKLIAQSIAWQGHLDILVNNAGTIKRAPAVDYTDADWDLVVNVNLNGVFTACRAAGRHMIARGSGKIINIASLLSFFGGFTVPAYAASKGGVGQLTKALSNEWSGKGVQVNAIAPGYMRTDNTAALQADPVRSKEILSRIPAGRWGEPSDLDGAIVFLASSASDYLSGHVMAVDGGWCGR
ncbi:MAG TPA: 2-dehydro-3-deoxy-D-gluconate 5-dehydrogenase KduD [Opitutaceae bacterium]|nr:2-dehydro-3-deoxy-D-gluconate 5-dehydrogenase KduD [Opitutaceae bacterium]